jgi:hypothetical protein
VGYSSCWSCKLVKLYLKVPRPGTAEHGRESRDPRERNEDQYPLALHLNTPNSVFLVAYFRWCMENTLPKLSASSEARLQKHSNSHRPARLVGTDSKDVINHEHCLPLGISPLYDSI